MSYFINIRKSFNFVWRREFCDLVCWMCRVPRPSAGPAVLTSYSPQDQKRLVTRGLNGAIRLQLPRPGDGSGSRAGLSKGRA